LTTPRSALTIQHNIQQLFDNTKISINNTAQYSTAVWQHQVLQHQVCLH
jgi:hypothetical protein